MLRLDGADDALNTKAALYGIQEVHPGFPAFFFQTKEPKRPINRYLHHYLNLENHSTSVSSTSGAKVSSMSRYSVGIPV